MCVCANCRGARRCWWCLEVAIGAHTHSRQYAAMIDTPSRCCFLSGQLEPKLRENVARLHVSASIALALKTKDLSSRDYQVRSRTGPLKLLFLNEVAIFQPQKVNAGSTMDLRVRVRGSACETAGNQPSVTVVSPSDRVFSVVRMMYACVRVCEVRLCRCACECVRCGQTKSGPGRSD